MPRSLTELDCLKYIQVSPLSNQDMGRLSEMTWGKFQTGWVHDRLVFRFQGTYCGQDVAIKVLNPERLNENSHREFMQEISIMRYVFVLLSSLALCAVMFQW